MLFEFTFVLVSLYPTMSYIYPFAVGRGGLMDFEL